MHNLYVCTGSTILCSCYHFNLFAGLISTYLALWLSFLPLFSFQTFVAFMRAYLYALLQGTQAPFHTYNILSYSRNSIVLLLSCSSNFQFSSIFFFVVKCRTFCTSFLYPIQLTPLTNELLQYFEVFIIYLYIRHKITHSNPYQHQYASKDFSHIHAITIHIKPSCFDIIYCSN